MRPARKMLLFSALMSQRRSMISCESMVTSSTRQNSFHHARPRHRLLANPSSSELRSSVCARSAQPRVLSWVLVRGKEMIAY